MKKTTINKHSIIRLKAEIIKEVLKNDSLILDLSHAIGRSYSRTKELLKGQRIKTPEHIYFTSLMSLILISKALNIPQDDLYEVIN